GFLACEIYEFAHYITEYGFTFRSSAFGSAFYAIVGFHGGHVLFGICWLIGLLIRNAKRGLNLYNAPKFNTFSLYWHFIDVVRSEERRVGKECRWRWWRDVLSERK